jgi:hypothetical protein
MGNGPEVVLRGYNRGYGIWGVREPQSYGLLGHAIQLFNDLFFLRDARQCGRFGWVCNRFALRQVGSTLVTVSPITRVTF